MEFVLEICWIFLRVNERIWHFPRVEFHKPFCFPVYKFISL